MAETDGSKVDETLEEKHSEKSDSCSLRREPTREEKTQAAVDEGHDADFPGNLGYVLDDEGERKRKASIASRRRSSVAVADADAKDVEVGDVKAETETAESSDDENVVFWDGDDDPQNPYNWPSWIKVLNTFLVSSLTFVSPLASSMFAPGVPQLMADFGSSSSMLGSFCVSVYVLGFAAGPMVFAPMSELYGRSIVYHFCNVGFIVFLIACAKAPSLGALIGFRFLSGVFGSCPITNGGGTIADMITQEKRGAAMASFSIGPLLGPIVGPVIGGVVAKEVGWRWVFWVLAITSAALSAVFLATSRETYAPVILARRAARLRRQTGNPLLRSRLDTGLSPRDYFRRGILRPFKLLLFSPICIFAGAYVGLAYAYLYLMFTSLTPLFMEIYGFDSVKAGLTFLGLGVGSMIGVAYFSLSSDRYIKKRAAQDNAAAEAVGRPKEGMKPEYRLPPLKFGAFVMPIGFFIYGWTADFAVHWIAPIIGTAVIGVGNLIIFMMYLIDTFTIYAASALAANTVMRSVAGAVLPLAGLPMYDALGLGWGNSLLGFVGLVLVPAPWVFMKYGELLRKKYAIKNI